MWNSFVLLLHSYRFLVKLLSFVSKIQDCHQTPQPTFHKDSAVDVGSAGGTFAANQSERNPSAWSRRDGNQRPMKMDFNIPLTEHVPRVLPKDEDPSLVKRNKRMLGELLGTLEGHIKVLSRMKQTCGGASHSTFSTHTEKVPQQSPPPTNTGVDKSISSFSAGSCRRTKKCPDETKRDTNRSICAFRQSSALTDRTGPMLHYNKKEKEVIGDTATKSNVTHVHKKGNLQPSIEH
ncbi:hypothetical protein Vadar_019436 [Vaccinium darrowii]|uniref:Uncharacterized protein n=1 Tax=Vaccinium darrowii TaxID=229202 RepID=A0ACB7XII8_9ERIC|nr:hypothetical protein Vadar_019436 [Vaccinium darrowii]